MSNTPISDLIINKLSYNQYKEVVSGNTYNNDQVYQIKDISNTFDTHTGTISNCILEIPQNLKLTLENNVLTLVSGSILTKTGSTYTTLTTTTDRTYTIPSNQAPGTYLILCQQGNGTIDGIRKITEVKSGTTDQRPAFEDVSLGTAYFNTDTKQWNFRSTTEWNENWAICYPVGLINVDSNHVATLAKDSNGNDIIFNGACFIGHHAICYPNIKGLLSNELDESGNLKSIKRINNALRIVELNQTYNTIFLTNWSRYFTAHSYMGEVKSINDLLPNGRYYYVKNINSMCRIYQNSLQENIQITPFISYLYDGTIVTDFTIQQPFRVDKNKSFTYRQW